ncbi:MAG: hypothetical protein LC099_05135 [Anaerolineales bacterium]|nr:hypothetical protein [Anaerolineales bacterium]
MSASLGLFRLQQIDSQLDRVKTRLSAIQKTLEDNKELKSAQERFKQAEAQNRESALTLKNLAAEVEALRVKIEQSNASLYGGAIKNPKELQDLEKEIVSLKKRQGELEERELEALADAEEREAQAQSAQSELNSVRARLENEHQDLSVERNGLLEQSERFAQERKAALAPVSADTLFAYDELRKQKRGVAVAQVEDDACAACGSAINAALQQNARAQKLTYCPSCGRILFAN